jgi:hypothetical protein
VISEELQVLARQWAAATLEHERLVRNKNRLYEAALAADKLAVDQAGAIAVLEARIVEQCRTDLAS